MSLPASLLDRLSGELQGCLGRRVTVGSAVPAGGGSINDAYRLGTDAGTYFLKVNSADRFPSMFEAEADGLHCLSASAAMRGPQVIAFGEDHGRSFLLLEHIDTGLGTHAFWERFGRSLAALHRCSAPMFGLERDNYIGSLRQANDRTATWPEFFVRYRLEPQVRLARDRYRIGMGEALRFERLFAKLPALFPVEPPALLHGDLWSGNFLCDAHEQPVLIDPAVYYGHREMDIAMTRLFGGFDDGFHAAYNDAWPLERGWEERIDLCNLYPLLVHVNLFGGGYVAQVEAALRRFV